MEWKLPPRIKVLEALGSLADGRVKLTDNGALVEASLGNKTYTVTYDPEEKIISANDNGSFWQGYLGYPALAFLMLKGVLPYEPRLAQALKGIAWKTINSKFKNDWDKTENYIFSNILPNSGVTPDELTKFTALVLETLGNLHLHQPPKKQRPPR